jgi:hypothetical protein
MRCDLPITLPVWALVLYARQTQSIEIWPWMSSTQRPVTACRVWLSQLSLSRSCGKRRSPATHSLPRMCRRTPRYLIKLSNMPDLTLAQQIIAPLVVFVLLDYQFRSHERVGQCRRKPRHIGYQDQEQPQDADQRQRRLHHSSQTHVGDARVTNRFRPIGGVIMLLG